VPHLIIEFSANLEEAIDIEGLVDAMHEAATGMDALPTGGIRTRAVARNIFRIADGHPDNGFISVTLRIAEGRSAEVRKTVGDTLFAALSGYVEDVCHRTPLSLALEVQEIVPENRWKRSNIRDYMENRRKPG
jgi:5-carboxymethyl-2-hydroxymuconate isomerase